MKKGNLILPPPYLCRASFGMNFCVPRNASRIIQYIKWDLNFILTCIFRHMNCVPKDVVHKIWMTEGVVNYSLVIDTKATTKEKCSTHYHLFVPTCNIQEVTGNHMILYKPAH